MAWLVTARKQVNFFRWLGFAKPESNDPRKLVLLIIVAFLICLLLGLWQLRITSDVSSSNSIYRGLGLAALPNIIIFAFVQTALSEEILFRGFLLKRLMAKFDFPIAAIAQAILLGIVHLAIALGQVDLITGIVIAVYPMIPALMIAYLNESQAGGSILPGYLIHGTANTISGMILAFA